MSEVGKKDAIIKKEVIRRAHDFIENGTWNPDKPREETQSELDRYVKLRDVGIKSIPNTSVEIEEWYKTTGFYKNSDRGVGEAGFDLIQQFMKQFLKQ